MGRVGKIQVETREVGVVRWFNLSRTMFKTDMAYSFAFRCVLFNRRQKRSRPEHGTFGSYCFRRLDTYKKCYIYVPGYGKLRFLPFLFSSNKIYPRELVR